MKFLLFIFLLLTITSCKSQTIDLSGQFWIPKNIAWSDLNPNSETDLRMASFKTLYVKDNSLFYFLSSYQGKDINVDSIAYGIEPGFKVYKGNYLIKGNEMFIEYCQIYGTFFVDTKIVKDTIVIDNGESPTLLIESRSYINTRKYTSYSRRKIGGQIKMAEDNILKNKN
jgi:hypothetical protein